MICVLSLVLVLAVSFGEMAEATDLTEMGAMEILPVVEDVTEQGANELTQEEKSNILTRHNQYRSTVQPPAANMVPLQWNDEIANLAQSWANQCGFSHNSPTTSEWSWVGQNIATGFGYTLDDLMDLWNNEKANYDFAAKTCATGKDENGKDKACGHYTQIAWATTTSVGCGKAECPREIKGNTYPFIFLVCNYGPGGNLNLKTTSPYKPGSPCSDCPSSGGACKDNLCTSG